MGRYGLRVSDGIGMQWKELKTRSCDSRGFTSERRGEFWGFWAYCRWAPWCGVKRLLSLQRNVVDASVDASCAIYQVSLPLYLTPLLLTTGTYHSGLPKSTRSSLQCFFLSTCTFWFFVLLVMVFYEMYYLYFYFFIQLPSSSRTPTVSSRSSIESTDSGSLRWVGSRGGSSHAGPRDYEGGFSAHSVHTSREHSRGPSCILSIRCSLSFCATTSVPTLYSYDPTPILCHHAGISRLTWALEGLRAQVCPCLCRT